MRKLFKTMTVVLAAVMSQNLSAQEYQLTPYTSFTKHGNHNYQVQLPVSGINAEQVMLEIELGCAEVGCSDWDYTVRFEWQNGEDKFELGRLITPYAGFMQRNMMGFDRNWRRKYLFDVSDLAPVLKGRGQLVAHYGGWGAKKSAFGFSARLITQGQQSAQPVKRVIPVYRSGSEGWGYKDAEHFAQFLPAKTFTLLPDETHAELKVTVSAHGHALSTDNPKGDPELCGEWCNRYFDLFQDGIKTLRQQLWRDNCDQSATYPQAGTYLFSRANWCPGEIVVPFSYPLNITDDKITLDIDWQTFSWQPSPWGNSAPRYIVSAHMVTYGDKARSKDIAVSQILSPNKNLDLRNTQSCGLVEVKVSNLGQTVINEATFNYGVVGANQSSFDWQGELLPGESKVVTLPGFNWGMFDAQTAEFAVTVSSMGDEVDGNNTQTSQIEAPIMLDAGAILALTTGSVPDDTEVEIVDRQGDQVKTWTSFTADTQHDLTLDLAKGCYTLVLNDKGRDGLFNHFRRSRQGQGKAALISNGEEIKLEADFGRQLKVPVTLDYPLGGCKESTWQTGQAYATPGELVSYEGIIYKARHWSYNFQPDKSGPWDAWEAVMYCDGTAI